jgi:hypothetical protein
MGRILLGADGGVGWSIGLLKTWWRQMDRWWLDPAGLDQFRLPIV